MGQETLYLQTDSPEHRLLLKDGRVHQVGRPAPEGSLILDCGGGRVVPGFVNAHTHLYSGLAPLGMPTPTSPPENFLQILERVWWRLDRALDETSLRAAARLYVAEALLHGTTTLVDHHESPELIEGSLDILAEACQELGMRALLCYGATERNLGQDEAKRGLSECRRFILSNQHPLIRGVVGLHASFTVSDETLQQAGALCRELDTVLHVHLAEDRADGEDACRRGYPGPLERLMRNHALVSGSILAHGVHLTREQVERTATENCWLVQNPRSNRGNGVGYPQSLWASPRVALGTDGYPADMPVENQILLELSRGRGAGEEEAAGKRLDTGRDLIGELFGGHFGPPREGNTADLVILDKEATPPHHVIVAGRLVVRDGALLTGDIDAIRGEAQRQAQSLWKRMRRL